MAVRKSGRTLGVTTSDSEEIAAVVNSLSAGGSLSASSEALEDLFCLSQCLTLSGSDGEALMQIALRQSIGRNGIKPVISTSE